MVVKYGKFEMPEKIKLDETLKTPHFGRFVIEPFERGFAHTLGNSLRRILLASLEAPAILSLRIEGVPHEYMAIEGVIEDMIHVILNFKATLLKAARIDSEVHPREVRNLSYALDVTQEMLDQKGGSYEVTAKELFEGSEFEVVNEAHVLFTVTKPMKKQIDIRVGLGRGYVVADRHTYVEKRVDEILLDASFSPVRLVNYYVENTRVGQDTDLDRLVLEVTTDGRISPVDAISFASQIGILHFQVFEHVKVHGIHFEKGEISSSQDRDEILQKLSLKIDEIELSVRSTNCLAHANIETIGELVLMPETEMLRFRNFGKKSLTEIRQKLSTLGLSLGMDLSHFGVHRDNVKQILEAYRKEKAAAYEGA